MKKKENIMVQQDNIEIQQIEDLEKMIHQLKEMNISKIEQIELSMEIKNLLEGKDIITTETNRLNNLVFDLYTSNKKDKCLKCERIADYIQVDSKEILCWLHSI